ncbi:hypothetical protein PSN45_001712 [Yamadazyma tenuis]|uniref:Trafficking protein particle complex subunit 11 domain-containing protein n=1 Tax=Candida tenuis (strain ATCC 10573 / BCRC 21748 / CBS 615 / JCM 9827 / NBRC 10315 / NRRL Y-1498 / VKM Y-70) TaxID=590646 RepID=G3BEF0_CANTC|nr:uncharacterized protein CANTEDRAFT_110716 [Yamadazyma tenuis ATCC 10573]EGV60529.1 hypothetical protein CANTEDRAFT_110716 [Yamadazyma tenuis ATCC 10573]WEJ94230.1 hypothetical protein PSN45_001712 [Yamadazyma tenuis]
MSVQLAYYDPFNVFPLIKPSLDSKLPLTNVHWRFNHSSALRSIPRLPVDLVEEVPKKVNDSIHVRLMFIQCNAIEIYKSQVRPLILEWLKHSVNDDVEWLIVLYSPIKKDKYSFKTSIFEKLKADFGKDGKHLSALTVNRGSKDRCFRLREPNDNDLNKLEVYNDLINFIKDLILASCLRNFETIDKQLSTIKDKDLFFVNLLLKKSMSFENLRLFKDSLNTLKDSTILLQNYYHKSPTSFKNILPEIDYKNVTAVFKECDILSETNYFYIISFVFNRKFKLLLTLVEDEDLFSIQCLYVSNLFQEMIDYLNILNSFFGDSVLQFNYHLIEYFMGHKVIKDFINTPAHEEVDTSYLHEFMGELKLFERSSLVKLGALRGYRIYEFNEVSLDDHGDKQKEIELVGELSRILKSKDSFLQYFENATETIIQHLVLCNRTKTIDVLSIDLALLNYQRQNYKESLNILQDSYQFFLDNNWNYMGGILLEIYVECIEKLSINNPALLVQSYIKLISNLKTTSEKVDINNYRLIKTQKQISKLSQNVIKGSESLQESFEFPIEKIFEVDLDPHIRNDGHNYYLELNLTNLYEIEFKFEHVELELSKGLTFKVGDVRLSEEKFQTVKLVSRRAVVGFFKPVKLTIGLSPKLKLIHTFTQVPDDPKHSILNDSMIFHNQTAQSEMETNSIYFYPSGDVFTCDIKMASDLLLGLPSIILTLKNGETPIQNVSVDFLTFEDFKYDKKNLELRKVDLEAGEKYLHEVPIQSLTDNKILKVKTLVRYDANETSYEFVTEKIIDTNLIVSVSVQDIFKSESIFSRFQVGSAISSPVRILSTQLVNADENSGTAYTIKVPRVTSENCIVYGEQMYTSFYKIELTEKHHVKPTDEFKLSVVYSSVVEECEEIMARLVHSEIESFSYAFNDMVMPKIRFDYQSYLLDSKLAILNILEITTLTDRIVQYLAPKERTKVRDSIINIINSTHSTTTTQDSFKLRSLNIYVPVSNIDILQIVEFKFNKKEKYVVGEPISVELAIESSLKWTSKHRILEDEQDISINAESSLLEDYPSKERFQVSIVNDDNWLISGFRKKIFSIDSKSQSTNKFNLVLIPLTVGKLSLPRLLIKLLDSRDLTMDISIKNGCETLLVVPELDNITFSF